MSWGEIASYWHEIQTAGGGGGTPGGADTQVQFNDGGVFAGDAGLTYDKATNALTVGSIDLTTALPLVDGGTGANLSTIAKGGLIAGTGAGTVGITTVGVDGTVLTADVASAGGVKWSAGPAATAGGADTTIQFNDGTVLAGNAAFTYTKAVGAVTLAPTADAVPLTVRAWSSGTNAIAQFQDSSNNVLATVGHTGIIDATGLTLDTPLALAEGGTGADQSAITLGGLLVGTGAGAVGIKAVGTNDHVLTADSGAAGGVKWAAATAADGLSSASGTAPLTLTLAAKGLTGSVAEFTGDAGAGGTAGVVPAPAAGDALKFLRGDKTWAAGGGGVTNSAGANVITKSDGTNVVATALSETSAGVLATSAGTALSVTATAPAATTGASQVGKSISMTASPAVASTDTASAAAGGGFAYTGGAAARNTSGNADGGSFVFTGGAGIGTGKRGTFQAPGAGSNSTAIGVVAIASNASAIAIGYNASCSSNGEMAIGANAVATGGTAVGPSASASGTSSVALGHGADTASKYGVAIGRDATLTAHEQLVIGGGVNSYDTISNVFIGSGVTNASASSKPVTIQSTGGSGTNIAGANLSVGPGLGTGTANPSVLAIKGDALGGTTGTTAHASVTRAVFNLSGKSLTSGAASSLFGVPLTVSPSSSGGQVLYTIRATDGTDEQVSTGVVNWVARRTGAGPTYASSTTVVNETTSSSSGALSTAWAFVDGTNKTTLQVTPTSTTITPTLIEIVCEVHSQGRSDIVPLPF